MRVHACARSHLAGDPWYFFFRQHQRSLSAGGRPPVGRVGAVVLTVTVGRRGRGHPGVPKRPPLTANLLIHRIDVSMQSMYRACVFPPSAAYSAPPHHSGGRPAAVPAGRSGPAGDPGFAPRSGRWARVQRKPFRSRRLLRTLRDARPGSIRE